jgi:hypothetical protein
MINNDVTAAISSTLSSQDQEPIQFQYDLSTEGLQTFRLYLKGSDRSSPSIFEINRTQLSFVESSVLDLFLLRHSDKLTTDYEILWHLAWLAELSCRHDPACKGSLKEYEALIRKQEYPQSEELREPGVSPLLRFVTQGARDLLWSEHRISIDDLERDSENLYVGLDQFRDKSDPHFGLRAKAYTCLLIEHHERVKHAGIMLGGSIGQVLSDQAQLTIDRILTNQARFFSIPNLEKR